MRIEVLGPIRVERDGVAVNVGGPQQRRLLALLVVHRGHPVSSVRLVDSLWPDGTAPDGATRSMRTYLSRLRAVLPEGTITTGQAGYALESGRLAIDLDEFDALVDEAERSLPDRAAEQYDRALALWRGSAFGELGDEWWAVAESSRLDERRAAAEEGRAAAWMTMGHANRAVPELERLTIQHPLRERPVRLLMQALTTSGRRAEAVRTYAGFRARLAEATGLEPSRSLAELEAAIVIDDGCDAPADARPLRGYTTHEAIGEGAYGRVYAATQPGTDRPVAIKVIRPEYADSAEFIRRFDAEARLVARLEHPHIVPLYDYWREPGGAYLVFRLLTGGTARDSVVAGGPWSVTRVSRLVEEIGGALIAAHATGVAHNDVKASNVMLDDAGAAYLSDFGIAVAQGAAASGAAVGARDISDLGWLAWELLTGSRPPARGSASSTTGTSARSTPSLIGRMESVPDGLDAVLSRATVSDGFASVAEFVLAWRAATGRPEGEPTPITSADRRAADSTRRLAARELARDAAGINPYVGLRPFDEGDRGNFHGRVGAIDQIAELVVTTPFVSVVGASGSGKSSVVRAGVVPRLRADGAVVVTMVPGEHPVAALRGALAEVSTTADASPLVDAGGGDDDEGLARVARRIGQLIVVIDQFEECWTRAAEDERAAFLGILARSCERDEASLRFLATVRADLLDRPLQHPDLGPWVGAGAYVLPPLSPADLDEAIVLPAARVGVTFEEGLVPSLVAEAVTFPGSLPLLQFALTELFDRRVDGEISQRRWTRWVAWPASSGGAPRSCTAGSTRTARTTPETSSAAWSRLGTTRRMLADAPSAASCRSGCSRSPTASSRRGCSSPTGTRARVSRPSRSPTRRCSADGLGSPDGWTRTAAG